MKKTGFISILGRPNVGKSTLLNAILGEKVAIVSSKPQTTRNRITGIHTEGDNQFVFLDTPGVHNPRTKLGSYMMKSVRTSVGASDAVILIAEAGFEPGEIERKLIDRIKKSGLPCVLVLNKIDLVNREKLAETITQYSALYDFDSYIPVSALKGKNVEIVLEECEKYLYESEWMFPDDIVTDQTERQIASEIIREKLLRFLSDEIPHGTAVVIEEFKEEKDIIRIRAEIFCEKASHKGIILGKGGSMLKKIGTLAREDMEEFFGTKVFLDLWVKVKEKWRDSAFNLNDFGYDPKNKD
ncbi:MAG: GTPase Era [Clostridia bacterium]|nr:GTPase Era [Clostridia bacterium]